MNPEKVINELVNMGRTELYALVSGGKDSLVAANITNRIHKLSGVIFIDTSIGLQETQDFVKATCKKNNWKLLILKPKVTYEAMVLKYGFPGPNHHRMAFIYLKWQPLYYWLKNQANKDNIALISGVRKHESKRRGKSSAPIKIDPTYKHMIWAAPIIDMTDKQVWDFVRKENIEVSPSYKTLHISGDCLCGAFSKRGEAELITQFYPKMAAKIRDLENKCDLKRCHWGRQSSMKGAKAQAKLESWLCADCTID